jgi:3'-5' exoribonuclease
MTVHKMARVLDADVDFADFFPASARDPQEMFAELRGLVAAMRNPHLKALLDAFLDDEPLARLYRTAPAAKNVHHAFLGGLIEHVLSVCRLCHLTSLHYGNLDSDLLLTGAILHDIGKVAELTYERSFGYSSEGQLLGHIVIGLRLLHEKLRQIPDFPPRLQVLVEHLIVSHHGELEFGSPKVPLFPEAMLLHHLDNLDSKMECMRALEEKDRHIEGCWTAYSPSLDRSILKKTKFLEDASPAREAAAPQIGPERQDGPVHGNGAVRENAARGNSMAHEIALPETGERTARDFLPEAPGSTEPAPSVDNPAAVDHPAPGDREPRPQPAVERRERFAPPSSPFAEKLQQAWRKDS